MDVTRNYQRRVQLNQVGLANEDLLRLLDEHFNLLFTEVDWFDSKVRRIRSDVLSDFEQRVNDVVKLVLVDTYVGGGST